jgi:superfamily I DNA/RNA helicase
MAQFKFNTISRDDIESSPGGTQMIHAIDYDGPNNLMITGCPGSGKTTVTIMRADRLVTMGKNILVITLQALLQTSLRNISQQNLSTRIHKFYKWYYANSKQYVYQKTEDEMLKDLVNVKIYDEILIDEGQDFESKIYRTLIGKSKKVTVGADNAQKVHDAGLLSGQIFTEIKKQNDVSKIDLQYNYRNTFEIYDFARHFLPYSERANNKLLIDKLPKGNGERPTIFLVPDHSTRLAQLKILLDNAGDKNVAVLVYHKDDVDIYFEIIKSMGISCSKHHSDDHITGEIENVIITTFKSAKGLEFQVVIKPNMERVHENKFMTDEHYYIGCTRATENLFLLINGPNLPAYFSDFEQESYKLDRTGKMSMPVLEVQNEELDDLPF